MSWKLDSKIERIVDKAIKEVPWEGTEVDKRSIIDNVNEFYRGIMKGLVTFVAKEYSLTSKGYKRLGKDTIHSREEIIEEFLKTVL